MIGLSDSTSSYHDKVQSALSCSSEKAMKSVMEVEWASNWRGYVGDLMKALMTDVDQHDTSCDDVRFACDPRVSRERSGS